MSDAPKQDVPLTSQLSGPMIPLWFRFVGAIIAIGLVAPCVVYLVRYTHHPERFVPPTELGVGFVILSGVLLLLVAIAPWRAIAQIFRKLGPIEFAQILETQSQEHAEDLSELRIRVDDLEEKARGLAELGPITEHLASVELYPLLSKFLQHFAPVAFSPVRIRQWGARQPGFEAFAKHRSSDIKIVLQKMVADGLVTTTVSKLGNTLYRSVNS